MKSFFSYCSFSSISFSSWLSFLSGIRSKVKKANPSLMTQNKINQGLYLQCVLEVFNIVAIYIYNQQSIKDINKRCVMQSREIFDYDRCNTMSTWKHTQRIPTQQQKWIITQKSSLPCKSGEGQPTPSLNALVQGYGRLREWFWTPSSLHSRA